MPVLRGIRARLTSEQPFAGVRVAACLHVTAETANLARALVAGGAEVGLSAANPFSTQDDIVAALREEDGIEVEVEAERGEAPEDYARHVEALAASGPTVAIDDGADLLVALALDPPPEFAGGLEETTTGLLRLRRSVPPFPVLAVNEALSERGANDLHGTGQSALDGVLRATNVLLAGQALVVLGYGPAGQGIARRARGAGAVVIVCEVDALRALEARMEGYEVMPALEAAQRGAIFITATGSRGVLGAAHFERMPDGAILANAGHFDVEIDLVALAALAVDVREVRPLVDEYDLGGRRLNLLARGRVVNLAAAEGHPAAVMDVSFALQALGAEELVRRPEAFVPGVQPVPAAIDREVARLKLAAVGVSIDTLTPEQEAYLSSWGATDARR